MIKYDNDLVTIDFSNESIGLTVRSFHNESIALEVFNNTIKTLLKHKTQFHNAKIINKIIKY